MDIRLDFLDEAWASGERVAMTFRNNRAGGPEPTPPLLPLYGATSADIELTGGGATPRHLDRLPP